MFDRALVEYYNKALVKKDMDVRTYIETVPMYWVNPSLKSTHHVCI